MFGQDRQQLRQYYHDIWQKKQSNQPLSALETIIGQVIEIHPEYHDIFSGKRNLEQEYFVENGQSNPYLHMGLHISLHEQISTDRPSGIRALYAQLQHKFGNAHDTEHEMMECLTEALWLAQRHNTAPSEEDYLQALRRLLD